MNATLTACNKDSSAGYVETLQFDNKEQFLKAYKEFEANVPFPRWYVEAEAEDQETETLVESWLE
jgi:hypothetical protein